MCGGNKNKLIGCVSRGGIMCSPYFGDNTDALLIPVVAGDHMSDSGNLDLSN